jgi:hypothetical protein
LGGGLPAGRCARLEYYLGVLEETREKTLAEFRKRNDKWLLSLDKVNPEWGRQD